jgi:hypothetical protein
LDFSKAWISVESIATYEPSIIPKLFAFKTNSLNSSSNESEAAILLRNLLNVDSEGGISKTLKPQLYLNVGSECNLCTRPLTFLIFYSCRDINEYSSGKD